MRMSENRNINTHAFYKTLETFCRQEGDRLSLSETFLFQENLNVFLWKISGSPVGGGLREGGGTASLSYGIGSLAMGES